MAVPRQRVLALMQASCRVFNTTYNPERVRLGSRILHQRLKGAAVSSYYPPRIGTIPQLRSLYPEHEILDDKEEDWLEHLGVAKSRGKSPPKKKRTAEGECVRLTRESAADGCRIEKGQEEEVEGEDGRVYIIVPIPLPWQECCRRTATQTATHCKPLQTTLQPHCLVYNLALAHWRSNSSSHGSRTLT